jgi:CubicO group peptidase (beta-lactamase class C family)
MQIGILLARRTNIMTAFSPSRLERVHESMRRHVERQRVPGIVWGLARHGEVHVDAIGKMAFDGQTPMPRDALFRLASTTKPITAVAAMILVEECRIRLDDPVDEWLPELTNRRVLRAINGPLEDTVPANRSITVRDLLTFRSGYGEVVFSGGMCPLQRALVEAKLPLSTWRFDASAETFMQRLAALPLACQPGERWLYHMSADILGVLIARVAGTSLGAFMRERIFDPLGMKDTGFDVPENKRARLPPCYAVDFSTGATFVADDPRSGLFSRPAPFHSGGGGLVSTADDLLAFGRMMANHGAYEGGRLLARSTIEAMRTDQITPEQKAASPFFPDFWDAFGWGFGLSVVTRRFDLGRKAGTFGWDGAFGTSFGIDPSEDLVGTLLVQRSPDSLTLMSAITTDFWTSAYQSLGD